VLIDGTPGEQLLLAIFVYSPHLLIPVSHLYVQDSIALTYLVPKWIGGSRWLEGQGR
jgi:hypothetical protein